MASYKQAVEWIACEDAVGDTPAHLAFDQAFDAVDGNLTIVMVADLWERETWRVALDVLKARGFNVPRGFVSNLQATR